MTKADFIAAYLRRATAAGFVVEATPDGCHYLAQDDEPDSFMKAVPCHCEGHDEGWHMEDVGWTLN